MIGLLHSNCPFSLAARQALPAAEVSSFKSVSETIYCQVFLVRELGLSVFYLQHFMCANSLLFNQLSNADFARLLTITVFGLCP